MSELAVLTEFKNPTLNKIGSEIIENYKGARDNLRKAQEQYNMAIIRRWRTGKIVNDNYEEIIAECGTQREFAERIGITEAMLSNDLRGYRAALDEGVNDEGDLLFLLQEKQIAASTRSWEKLPRLLSEPQSSRQKDNRPKDEKRLEELIDEADEILHRQFNQNKDLAEEANHVKRHIGSLKEKIKYQNPINVEWEKEGYLEFIRSFGMDMLTGEAVSPDERLEPHHINPFTGNPSGGVGNKLADVWTIPTLQKTHRMDHSSDSPYSKEDYKDALLKVMATFIIENY